MWRLCVVLSSALLLLAGLPAEAAKAKKKSGPLTGVVQSISADTIAIKGFEAQPDGSATNFDKKLKVTSDTKFVNVQGHGKKAEETAASRGDVRTGMKVAFTEKDGAAEKIMIPQKGKKKNK